MEFYHSDSSDSSHSTVSTTPRVNTLDEMKSSLVSVSYDKTASYWYGQKRVDNIKRKTKNYGTAAGAILALTCLELARTSEIDGDGNIALGTIVNNFGFDEFRAMLDSHVRMMRASRMNLQKYFRHEEFTANDPVVGALNLVVANLRDSVRNKTWQNNADVVEIIVGNLVDLRDKHVEGRLTPEDDFIFAGEVGRGLSYDDDAFDKLNGMANLLEKNEFSFRAISRGLYHFICHASSRTEGSYQVPPKLSKTHLIDGILWDAIDHGAESMWRHLLFDHPKFLSDYLTGHDLDNITVEEKKVLMLPYLWDEEIVRQGYEPLYSLSRDKPLSRNVTLEVKRKFWNWLAPLIRAAEARIKSEREKRANLVRKITDSDFIHI